MNAFASDLDRTLIYSTRSGLGEHPDNCQLVEMYNGKPLSYISTQTKENLQKIMKEMLFIPVTTRTAEQYNRISLFNENEPKYAVVSNGGIILEDGKPIKEWSEYIERNSKHSLPLEEMVALIKQFPIYEEVEKLRFADNLFFYLIFEKEKAANINTTPILEWGNRNGWQVSLQGKKLYFIPNAIDKWEAVHYLQKRLSIRKVISAGDSLLDKNLIEKASYGIAPAHGEILKHHPFIRSTSSYGMKASEEITSTILTDQLISI